MNEVDQIVKHLQLQPHPEGGFYRRTYASAEIAKGPIMDDKYHGPRHFCTSIYYLLTGDSFSAFHRLPQDEIWHFYKGAPIKIHMINEASQYSTVLLGTDLLDGQAPQYVVPGDRWFAATSLDPDHYSLVGCTVAPGFDFEDFTLANRAELISTFPSQKEIISRLTRA
jgi:predicted cupin superfamily sugar epimerase